MSPFFYTTASTDFYFTFTTASTSSTDLTFTVLKSRSSQKMPPKLPDPPLRGGEIVRVTGEGFLKGRTGTVMGFLEADGKRIAFVNWPDGGNTTIAENDLRRVKGDR